MPGENIKLFPLRGTPGIKKDTTSTEGNYWSDGNWVRFYRGLPRSMMGYQDMTDTFPGPSRGLLVNAIGNGYFNLFSGSSDKLVVGQFNGAGVGSSPADITPSGFVNNANNVWQLDSVFNGNGGGQVSICAHAAPNLSDIANTVAEPIYYGNIQGTAALIAAVDDHTPTPNVIKVDGGILALAPFLIGYGSDGLFIWSDATNNNIGVFPAANGANICSTKIVKGLSIRGGSTNPSCLLWSLDSVIQASFVGGTAIWNFNTISDQSSILSSSAVVEMDGIYYWPGIDRWLTFDGVLKELKNELSLDFFYTNLNYAQRQKVVGYKVPRWGEIVWLAPMFGATENNWMFVFNKRENCWYDTPLPSDGRSAAVFAEQFPHPILSSANGLRPIGQNTGTVYPMWEHEVGYSAVRGNEVDAINSWVITPSLSLVGGGLSLFNSPAAQPEDVWTEVAFFEQDFLFNETLQITLFGRMYPQDEDAILNQTIISKTPTENFYALQCQERYLFWKIEANEMNGYFIMGQPLLAFRPGDRSR